MKIITVIAEQISPQALSTALPAEGVVSVTVDETQAFCRTAAVVESYRGRKIANHFTTVYRIEVTVQDDALQAAIDGITFARSAGLFGEATARVATDTVADLFAARSATAAA